jgi:hypothetical protein
MRSESGRRHWHWRHNGAVLYQNHLGGCGEDRGPSCFYALWFAQVRIAGAVSFFGASLVSLAACEKCRISTVKPEKKPLFRRVNTKTHRVEHGDGGKSRWERNTKKTKNNGASRGSMHKSTATDWTIRRFISFCCQRLGRTGTISIAKRWRGWTRMNQYFGLSRCSQRMANATCARGKAPISAACLWGKTIALRCLIPSLRWIR